MDNPLKNFDFALEVDGIIQAGLQEVTRPSVEKTKHKHGRSGNRTDKKTPGKKIVGDLVIGSLVNVLGGSPEIWEWFLTTDSNLSAAYKRDGFLVELNNGVPVARYFLEGMWPQKIEDNANDTREDNSADMIRNITLSVDDYYRIP